MQYMPNKFVFSCSEVLHSQGKEKIGEEAAKKGGKEEIAWYLKSHM